MSSQIQSTKLRAALVLRQATIAETLKHMSHEVALVVDSKGRLCGLLTDGDIRRAFLAGAHVDTPVAQVMTVKPLTIPPDLSPREMQEIMLRHHVRHLPVVDKHGRPIGLELLKEHYDEMRSAGAVIMAGGKGARLRPLTENTPKPLLPLGESTILDNLLGGLNDAGINDVVISVNYLREQIKDHVGQGTNGLHVSYVEEEKQLGTAGSLALIEPKPRHSVVVMNGDLVTDLDLNAVVRFHRRHANDLTVCVRRHSIAVPYGVVTLDPDKHKVHDVQEKPAIDFLVNAGIYILEPQIISLVSRGSVADMVWLIREALANGRKVAAFPILEYWRDVGQHQEMGLARQEWQQRKKSRRKRQRSPATTVPATCHAPLYPGLDACALPI